MTMETKLTNLEKQLIVMSLHGIYIENAHGHRWIQCEETTYGYSYHEELRKCGVSVNNKVYGGFLEAVLVVDHSFYQMYGRWLIDFFDYDEEDIKLSRVPNPTGRIDMVEPGEGGLN